MVLVVSTVDTDRWKTVRKHGLELFAASREDLVCSCEYPVSAHAHPSGFVMQTGPAVAGCWSQLDWHKLNHRATISSLGVALLS